MSVIHNCWCCLRQGLRSGAAVPAAPRTRRWTPAGRAAPAPPARPTPAAQRRAASYRSPEDPFCRDGRCARRAPRQPSRTGARAARGRSVQRWGKSFAACGLCGVLTRSWPPIQDSVPQMSGRRGIDHLTGFEPDMLTAEVLEQPGTAAEQHGHEVDLDLLGQSRPDVLLPDFRAAHDVHVLVPGRCPRLLQGAPDSAGHDGVHTSLGYLIELAVRDDEHRQPGAARRPIRSPPRHRGVVGTPARDERSRGTHGPGEDLAVAPARAAERPLMESLATIAHRLFRANIRRGYEPI